MDGWTSSIGAHVPRCRSMPTVMSRARYISAKVCDCILNVAFALPAVGGEGRKTGGRITKPARHFSTPTHVGRWRQRDNGGGGEQRFGTLRRRGRKIEGGGKKWVVDWVIGGEREKGGPKEGSEPDGFHCHFKLLDKVDDQRRAS